MRVQGCLGDRGDGLGGGRGEVGEVGDGFAGGGPGGGRGGLRELRGLLMGGGTLKLPPLSYRGKAYGSSTPAIYVGSHNHMINLACHFNVGAYIESTL